MTINKSDCFGTMFDYHLHTSLCNHARGTMQEYIVRAEALGLREVCFLDHLTLHPAGRANSMTAEQVGDYVAAVRRLANRFRGRIEVRVGLEVDVSREHAHAYRDIIGSHPFDVIGGSVHFVSGVNVVSRSSQWARGSGDAERICRGYFENLELLLEDDCFDVICHLDLINKFSNAGRAGFEQRIDGLIDTIKDRGLAVEVNTAGYDHPRRAPYPSLDLLKRFARAGIPVTLGSDAHRPEEVGRHFEAAVDYLQRAGYREVAGFRQRVMKRVPLKRAAVDAKARGDEKLSQNSDFCSRSDKKTFLR